MMGYTAQVLEFIESAYERCALLRGAEIGIAHGPTACAMLQHFPNLHLIMVDKWKRGELRRNMDQCLLQAKQNTEFARERRIIFVGDSIDAARLLPHEFLDFVFIDANHYYDYVVRDLAAWSRKVRRGGLLIGHDYDVPHDQRGTWGVKRAVDEFVATHGYKLRLGNNSVWATIRE